MSNPSGKQLHYSYAVWVADKCPQMHAMHFCMSICLAIRPAAAISHSSTIEKQLNSHKHMIVMQ